MKNKSTSAHIIRYLQVNNTMKKHYLDKKILDKTFQEIEKELFNSKKLKFQKLKDWRNENIPNEPGIYAFFNEKDEVMYIGESGNINARMDEVNRTVNHSFRKQLGAKMFGGIKSSKKFDSNVEEKLDEYFSKNVYLSFLLVNFGRLEIETFLIDKHQNKLYNSEKKRK